MKRNMYGAMNTNYKSLILAISLLLALSASISAAPGDLDPTFGNGGIVISTGGSINTLEAALGMALQADGKIVAVGYGAAGGSSLDFAVARYNTDGSPDTSFGGSGVVVTPLSNCNDFALSVAIQADGKIVVAGFITNFGGGNPCDGGGGNLAVVRYNPNGSLDTTFNRTGIVFTQINNATSSSARSVAIQADGKIVVAGDSYDSSSGGFTLVRYNTNGSLDTSFDNDGIVVTTGVGGAFAVAIQADGKIVAAGYGVIRYNADGSLDTTFNGTGIVTTPDSLANSVAIQADGKILTTSGPNWFSGDRLVRYNANGTPDTSFGGTGSVAVGIYVTSAVVQADGKIVAAGYTEFGDGSAFAVIRLNGNGSLDATFGGTGTVITPIVTQVYYSSGANAVAIQPDGKIVAAGGVVDRFFDLFDFALVRYQGDSISPTSCPNPIDCAEFFVRQHYLDFLGREPDAGGQDYWTQQIADCGSDQRCISHRRIGVSGAFFGEPEFQRTGSFVYRLYKGGLGRRPSYSEFESDRDNIVEGPTLEQTKQAFTLAFVQRSGFIAAYSGMTTADLFVDALIARVQQVSGVNLAVRRSEFVSVYANGADQNESQAQVLRLAIDDPGFTAAEYNPSFVLMEYFGYLHRDPDQAGYDFWLDIINNREPNNYRGMVCAFITSQEYQLRFGSTLTRSNADCGQ